MKGRQEAVELMEGLVMCGVLPAHWVLEGSALPSRQTQNFLMERRNKALGGGCFPQPAQR